MIRELHIKAVLNGYIVNVGCQTVVFNSPADMLKDLGNYLDKPWDVEQRYTTTALNANKFFKPQAPECNTACEPTRVPEPPAAEARRPF